MGDGVQLRERGEEATGTLVTQNYNSHEALQQQNHMRKPWCIMGDGVQLREWGLWLRPRPPSAERSPHPPAMSGPPAPYDRVMVNMAMEEVQIQRLPDPHLVSTTTGGVEGACHRCLLPFSTVAALIGVAVTALAYARDAHGSVLCVLGLALLGAGVLGLAGSCLARCCRGRKIRGWRSGSFTLLTADQLQKKMMV
ncbi:transmembrane protein 100-like [Emydura macquarii macquarii]|uniref:transmembrane protein 100-like n=1 Tax=Emydura macquarii macquarii TaxID=1129001 RepID=UPI00352BA3E6